MSSKEFTTLAFVALDADGNRDFSFARNNSADTMLFEDEVDESLIEASRIFHCGTLSLTHEAARASTLKALKAAKAQGTMISVDPNLRLSLWSSETAAKEAIDLVLSYADIVKISDYEVEFLCGEGDVVEGAKKLYEKYQPKIMFVTCGKDGAFLLKADFVVKHGGYDVNVIDTTGAGDSFCGAALTKLLCCDLAFDALTEADCLDILSFANKTASLSTTRHGAIASMPRIDEML